MSKTIQYPHSRFFCEVLEDMRSCLKAGDHKSLKSLVEEAQVVGNRMESSLRDRRDIERMTEEVSELRDEIKKLKKKRNKLRKKAGVKKEKDNVFRFD